MRRYLAKFTRLALFAAAILAGTPAAQAGSGELRIGITQFPSTLNPLIDSMLAKSYVLAMTHSKTPSQAFA